MKTDRVRDMLKHMAERAIANEMSFATFAEGIKPELKDRARALYEVAAKEKAMLARASAVGPSRHTGAIKRRLAAFYASI